MNFAAILLGYLGVLVFAIVSLVTLGLAVARKLRAARITFAAGLLSTTIIAALATLSFLQKGMGFYQEGSEPTIAIITITLLMAGAGQFFAAVRRPATYAASLAFALGALLLLATPLLGGDLFYMPGVANLFALHSLSLPWLTLGLAVCLLLATVSLLIPALPTRRRQNVSGS